MPAYLLFIREHALHDEGEMQAYRDKLRINPPASSRLKPLALYGSTIPLEGEAPDGIVLFEFPTVEDARKWYNSPAYQEALMHRKRAGTFRVLIVEGISKDAFWAAAGAKSDI